MIHEFIVKGLDANLVNVTLVQLFRHGKQTIANHFDFTIDPTEQVNPVPEDELDRQNCGHNLVFLFVIHHNISTRI